MDGAKKFFPLGFSKVQIFRSKENSRQITKIAFFRSWHLIWRKGILSFLTSSTKCFFKNLVNFTQYEMFHSKRDNFFFPQQLLLKLILKIFHMGFPSKRKLEILMRNVYREKKKTCISLEFGGKIDKVRRVRVSGTGRSASCSKCERPTWWLTWPLLQPTVPFDGYSFPFSFKNYFNLLPTH